MPAAFAGNPRRDVETYLHRGKAGPYGHAAEEAHPFRKCQQRVHGLTIQQPEIRRRGKIETGQHEHEPIEQEGIHPRHPAIAGPGDLLGSDNMRPARAPRFEQSRQQRRRMLSVGVHDHDRASPRMAQAGENRRFLAEISSEPDALEPRMAVAFLPKPGPGVVPAPVVDDPHLMLGTAGLQYVEQPIQERRDSVGLVEGRHDDAEFGRARLGRWRGDGRSHLRERR